MLEGTTIGVANSTSYNEMDGQLCASEDLLKQKLKFNKYNLELQICEGYYSFYTISLKQIGPFIKKFSVK